jgi:hypothetical protein
LEITNNRCTPASHRIVASEADHPFCIFLREFAQESTLSQDTHVVGGDCLDSYLKFKPFMAKFLPFSKTKKGPGYYIPPSKFSFLLLITRNKDLIYFKTSKHPRLWLLQGGSNIVTAPSPRMRLYWRPVSGELLLERTSRSLRELKSWAETFCSG